MRHSATVAAIVLADLLATAAHAAPRTPTAYDLSLVNRVTWGVTSADVAACGGLCRRVLAKTKAAIVEARSQ